MTTHSHFPFTSTNSSTPHNTNIKHHIHHIHYTNTQQTFPQTPHTVATTDIKTNMRHIHTSIVSRHLATRGNNKILRTPPPHISSSEDVLPCLTRRTLAQLITNKSPLLKSYLHKVDREISWLVDQKRDDRTPPQTRVKG